MRILHVSPLYMYCACAAAGGVRLVALSMIQCNRGRWKTSPLEIGLETGSPTCSWVFCPALSRSQTLLPVCSLAPWLANCCSALDADVHYLEYCMHGCLTIGSFLPQIWNQAFIKKTGLYPHLRVIKLEHSHHCWSWNSCSRYTNRHDWLL